MYLIAALNWMQEIEICEVLNFLLTSSGIPAYQIHVCLF